MKRITKQQIISALIFAINQAFFRTRVTVALHDETGFSVTETYASGEVKSRFLITVKQEL